MNSNTIYENRYGRPWSWEPITESTFLFKMDKDDMMWCREGHTQDGFIYFFDPSGGPYVGVGGTIDNIPITRIIPTPEGYVAEVSNQQE